MTKDELIKLAEDEHKSFADRFDALMAEAKALSELDGFVFKPTSEMARKAATLKSLCDNETRYNTLANAQQSVNITDPAQLAAMQKANEVLLQNQADVAALNPS